MTVKELIEQLKLYDPEMEVVTRDEGSIDYLASNKEIYKVCTTTKPGGTLLRTPDQRKVVIIS